jgi:toxin ParE1/3/4
VKVEWLPRAEGDRHGQLDYVAERNPSAAIRLGDAIEASMLRLADHPMSGRSGRVGGTRELTVAGTPYIIIYRVEVRRVVVLRLLHGALQWPGKA